MRTASEIDSVAHHEQHLRRALAGEPTVRWAYLFGSAARGEQFHDLDVAVMLTAEGRGAVAFGRVVSCAEEAGEGLRVDVVDLASAAPALIGRIPREGRVLVDREPAARRSWEIDVNRCALDIEPWLTEFERLHNEAIRRRGAHGRS